MDQCEVTNLNYREYEYWLITHYVTQPEVFRKALPDTLVWRTRGSSGSESEFYYRYPSYNNHPVVGVTFRQAQDYCAWRTARVNEYLAAHPKEAKRWTNCTFEYRLPTAAEWTQAAAAGLDTTKYPWGFEQIWNGRTGRVFHCRTADDEPSAHRIETTVSVWESGKNKLGYYGMIGNVAEMITEEGQAKGGSWQHDPDDSRVSGTQTYRGAEKWLGFRCVCIVKRKQ